MANLLNFWGFHIYSSREKKPFKLFFSGSRTAKWVIVFFTETPHSPPPVAHLHRSNSRILTASHDFRRAIAAAAFELRHPVMAVPKRVKKRAESSGYYMSCDRVDQLPWHFHIIGDKLINPIVGVIPIPIIHKDSLLKVGWPSPRTKVLIDPGSHVSVTKSDFSGWKGWRFESLWVRRLWSYWTFGDEIFNL